MALKADPIYVEARRVLLDALGALEPHASAVIVAGAQAVYLRTGDAGVEMVAPYTTDGDLALNPDRLDATPDLEAAMSRAGFRLAGPEAHPEPGIWIMEMEIDGVQATVPIDLIVPEGAASPGGRRGARLAPHGRRAARRARGLEAVLIDHSPVRIAALDPTDPRVYTTEVAGVASLLVAKAHKIHDRVESGRDDRLDDKDAGDVLRLMQTTSPDDVGVRLASFLGDPVATDVSAEAIGFLEDLFGRRGRPGVEMAVRAFRVGLPRGRAEAVCTAYIEALLRSADRASAG